MQQRRFSKLLRDYYDMQDEALALWQTSPLVLVSAACRQQRSSLIIMRPHQRRFSNRVVVVFVLSSVVPN